MTAVALTAVEIYKNESTLSIYRLEVEKGGGGGSMDGISFCHRISTPYSQECTRGPPGRHDQHVKPKAFFFFFRHFSRGYNCSMIALTTVVTGTCHVTIDAAGLQIGESKSTLSIDRRRSRDGAGAPWTVIFFHWWGWGWGGL